MNLDILLKTALETYTVSIASWLLNEEVTSAEAVSGEFTRK